MRRSHLLAVNECHAPLRRSLIIEQGLAFPEGKAAAEVLRAGDNPAHGVKVLATAGLLGGLGKFAAASGLNLIPDTAFVSAWLGKTIAYFGTNLCASACLWGRRKRSCVVDSLLRVHASAWGLELDRPQRTARPSLGRR